MSYITRNCDYCDNEYQAETRYLNRGEGTYCSRQCSSKGAAKKRKVIHEPNVTCSYCSIPMYVKSSRLKNSKSGNFFCSIEHQNLAAMKTSGINYFSGKTVVKKHSCEYENCIIETLSSYCKIHRLQTKIDLWLSGDLSVTWIKTTKEPHPWVKKYIISVRGDKCEICGWEEKAPDGRSIIQMDHIDGNYTNNSIENLKLLCPNHHAMTPTYGSLNKNGGRVHRRKIAV